MNARTFASRTAAAGVAAIAAIASYSHMENLAHDHGQTALLSALMPVSVDGLMVVATVAIADGRTHRWSAWFSFWLGVVASISANILAARPDIVSRLISAWPSIALLAVVEMIARSGRAVAAAEAPIGVKTQPSEPVTVPAAKSAPRKPAAPRKSLQTAKKVARTAARMPDAKPAKIAAALDVSEATVRRYLPPTDGPIGVNGARVDELAGEVTR
jgi:hypothetical protein